MRDDGTGWEQQDERTWTMQLAAEDWLEVKRNAADPQTWHVDTRLGGSHYKVRDAFRSKVAAQGCGLLLAMRLLPSSRDALHARLDVLPGAWWWKITPLDEPSSEHRSIFSSRVSDSAASAEQSGRAAGGGWWLYVYGPGSVLAFGHLPR